MRIGYYLDNKFVLFSFLFFLYNLSALKTIIHGLEECLDSNGQLVHAVLLAPDDYTNRKKRYSFATRFSCSHSAFLSSALTFD